MRFLTAENTLRHLMANIKRCAAKILNWVSQIAAIFNEPQTKIRFRILEVLISEKGYFCS